MSIFSLISSILIKNNKQRMLFLFVLITIGLTAALSAFFPLLFSLGIDQLASGFEGYHTGLKYILAFGCAMLLVGIFEQVQWLSFGPLNLRLQRHLTLRIFQHAISLPYYTLKETTTYEVSRIVQRGLDATRDIVTNLSFFLIPTILELIISSIIIAIYLDIYFSIILILALFFYGAVTYVSSKAIKESTEEAMESGVEAWGYGLDGVANAELIQQSSSVNFFIHDLNKKLRINDQYWLKTFKQRCFYGCLQAVIFGAVVIFVLWKGVNDVNIGHMSLGSLVLLNTYIIRLLQPVETFARIYREVQASLGETKLLIDLLTVPAIKWDRIPFSDNKAFSISLRNISIHIGEKLLLKNINFEVSRCQKIFIVGKSGIGKSSLIKTIACLTPHSFGEYSIDNQLIDANNMSVYRPYISVVQQECLLFNLPLIDNIKFGTEATEEETKNIINKLGLSHLLKDRNGEDYYLGEKGNRLSGGERQRISFARAILTKPKLIILDEPTSSLDIENTKLIMDMIDELSKNVTIIVVTHEYDIIKDDDWVFKIINNDHTEFNRKKFLL